MDDRARLAYWSIAQAVIWVHDRDDKRLLDFAFRLPSLRASQVYPQLNTICTEKAGDEGFTWIEAAGQLLSCLKANVLQAARISDNGFETPISAGHWNTWRISDFDHADDSIMLLADEVRATFIHKRPGHAEVVAWCRQYRAAGKGNGMDRAWDAFRNEPAHEGLTRDDVFRPAWNEAKAK